MLRERAREFLFPSAPERDAAFVREIQRLALRGLAITGAVEIGLSLFMVAARFVLTPETATLPLRVRQGALILLLGLVDVALSRVKAAARWARLLGCLSAVCAAAVLMWSSMMIEARSTNPNDFIPGQITLVMLIAVTVLPLRPMHTFALGVATGFAYLVAALIAERTFLQGLGPDENYLLFILMLSILCTGITGIMYAQRWSNFVTLRQTVEAGEALREAQTRMVLSESAVSLSRLAAAVSHEMNNPVGALLSGVDTLLLLAARQATSTADEQHRLVRLQADVRKSIQESAQRLRDLVARMQRFTNLDQAEVQNADINEILRDVAALSRTQDQPRPQMELNLEPLPALTCRPQQLSVLFGNLIDNALQAVNGGGKITISTRRLAGEVEIEIEDNGRGLPESELRDIFDPSFRVTNGRMAASNWNMFNSRQIVREHGGDIRIASREGKGTRVTIVLPVESELAAAERFHPAAE